METYIVKVNGKTYEVEVEKQGEQAVQSIEPVKKLVAIEDAIGTGGYLRYIGQNLESCTDRGRAGEKGRHHHDLGGHEDGNSDRLSL